MHNTINPSKVGALRRWAKVKNWQERTQENMKRCKSVSEMKNEVILDNTDSLSESVPMILGQ